MVVKEVESLKTRLVELFGQGGSYVGVLHLLPEEDHGGQHEGGREEQEDEGRPSQPLPRPVLHHQVEGEVHAHVDEEEEEQHRGELYVGHEEETTTEESVDCHEPDQKTQPTHNKGRCQKKPDLFWTLSQTYLIFVTDPTDISV